MSAEQNSDQTPYSLPSWYKDQTSSPFLATVCLLRTDIGHHCVTLLDLSELL